MLSVSWEREWGRPKHKIFGFPAPQGPQQCNRLQQKRLIPYYSGTKSNMVAKIYGLWPRRGMGYGLSRTYGVFHQSTRPPSWWTGKAMGYRGLWVIRGMGYGSVDCIHNRSHLSNSTANYIGDHTRCVSNHTSKSDAHLIPRTHQARVPLCTHFGPLDTVM